MGYKTDKISQRVCTENKHYYIKYHTKLKRFVSHRFKICYYANKKRLFFQEKKMLENTAYKKLFLTIQGSI